MTKKTTWALAAFTAATLLLAGCDADGDGLDDQTGQPVTTGAQGNDSPDCDPDGFGPLSGCGGEAAPGGEIGPMGKDDWPGADALSDMLDDSSPDGGTVTFVVTKKYHADAKSCAEFRAFDDQDRFRRVCVPDEYATDQDRDWLTHQVVGQHEWTGEGS
jgi:hypothetical protein